MSAFIVGHDHIDGLLTFAVEHKLSYYVPGAHERVYFDRTNASEIGAILLTENERSVGHRYGDDDDLPGSGEGAYQFRRFEPFLMMPVGKQALTVLKACDCFDYQACETDDYEASLAYRIIDAIRGAAIRRLSGYEGADGWELRRPKDAPTVVALSDLIK
jgi:hypothetical protein